MFVVEPAANLVSRIIISDDGTTLRARKAYDQSEFLTSTDERFRPVYLSNAPDGTLYLVDMYRGIIQHRGYITEYLHQQIVSRKLDAPPRHGRIYRIVHDSTRRAAEAGAERSRRTAAGRSALASATAGTATRRSGSWSSAHAIVGVAVAEEAGRTRRLTRARGCTRCGRSTASTRWSQRSSSARAGDASRDVRAAAVRLAEPWLGGRGERDRTPAC